MRYATAALRVPGGGLETIALYTPEHEHRGHAPHEPGQLFLPFRDATSGRETYGAGRYLEVVNPLAAAAPRGESVLDFNFAYSPFCAYSQEYVCPLPPRENWLKGPVRAGERTPPGAP